MSNLSFSRVFPATHPKAGQPTYFVEQILNELGVDFRTQEYRKVLLVLNAEKIADPKCNLESDDINHFWGHLNRGITGNKLHTIRKPRKANDFHAGDFASPFVWSGKPYQSPQIIFVPPAEVRKVLKLRKETTSNGKQVFYLNGYHISPSELINLAANDGLSESDFLDWFATYPDGMMNIICWGEVNY